jgi:hypothetical protein
VEREAPSPDRFPAGAPESTAQSHLRSITISNEQAKLVRRRADQPLKLARFRGGLLIGHHAA